MANKSKDRLGSDSPEERNEEEQQPRFQSSNDPQEMDRSARRDDAQRETPRPSIEAEQQRQFTEDEYLEMFLETFANAALPKLPPIPGYHLCWLSTTNSKDTIAARLRIGYQIVQPGEITGYDNLRLNNGDYAGCIGVNEMILAKLPLTLFDKFMTHLHHKLPLDEAAKLRYRAEALKDEAQGKYGADVIIGGGLKTVDQFVRSQQAAGRPLFDHG